MKAKTKENLGLIFGSLFSNRKAVNAGKSLPWWMALIAFFLAVFLPVIPTMVSISKSYGSQMFANGYTYGIDTQLCGTTIDIVKSGYEFKIGEEHKLLAYKDGKSFNPTTSEDVKPIAKYSNTITKQIDFEIYYSIRPAKGKDNLQNLLDTISKRTYIVGTSEEGTTTTKSKKEASKSSSETLSYYIPSFMLLYADGMVLYTYKANTTTINGNTGGDWKHHEIGESLFESISTVLVNENETLKASSDVSKDELMKNSSYVNGVFTNWKNSLDLSYLNNKDRSFTYSTLIFLGIYIALSFFMGLMVFLLTRGKKNVYRYLSLLTCEKINAWASFCPGLLAMILGFLMPNYAVMFFIALLGLRIMWLSMKELRPQYN